MYLERERNTNTTSASPRPRNYLFARVVEAGRRLEAGNRSNWKLKLALAEALHDECGPPGENGRHNGSGNLLKQAHRALAAAGIHLHFEYLRDLRQFWHKFPDPGDRSPGCSWTVHLKCGNPETLHAVIEQAEADGLERSDITVAYVRKFLEQRRLEIEKKNREAHDKLKDRERADPKHEVAVAQYLAAIANAEELLRSAFTAFQPYRQQLTPAVLGKLERAEAQFKIPWAP